MNNRVRLLICALILTSAGFNIGPGATGGAAFQSDDIQPTHWAFIAPVRPPLPKVRNGAWVRTPIDSFILAGIEKAMLTPAPEADAALATAAAVYVSASDVNNLPPDIDLHEVSGS
jgi:hypothetical protein